MNERLTALDFYRYVVDLLENEKIIMVTVTITEEGELEVTGITKETLDNGLLKSVDDHD